MKYKIIYDNCTERTGALWTPFFKLRLGHRLGQELCQGCHRPECVQDDGSCLQHGDDVRHRGDWHDHDGTECLAHEGRHGGKAATLARGHLQQRVHPQTKRKRFQSDTPLECPKPIFSQLRTVRGQCQKPFDTSKVLQKSLQDDETRHHLGLLFVSGTCNDQD